MAFLQAMLKTWPLLNHALRLKALSFLVVRKMRLGSGCVSHRVYFCEGCE